MTRDPDYTGPLWDTEDRVGYLTVDNTRLAARTSRIKSDTAIVFADYDENDNLLGIEVLW